MDIREFLQLLKHVSGPNSSGEYTARCPCHDDKTASLTVTVKASPKDGRDRIYFHCHAGCSGDAIMARLGLKPVDLILNPEPAKGSAKPGRTRKKAADPQSAPPPPKAAQGEKPKIDYAHPEAVYSYTDAEGNEVFQVCRYAYTQDGKPAKTFRQRRYDPQNPDANRQGYVNKVPAELRDSTLYKMPEITAAMKEGRPVYVVEGEKDVETLLRLGYAATCNPGGAGKWRESYSRLLAGADIIILPDCDTKENDYTGQNHALDVALRSRPYAKRVRLVDIKEACPELPAKGDISDMVKILGETEAMDALARQVAATRDFDPSAVPFWLTPMEQAARLYAQVPGYAVDGGCIEQITNDGARLLTDFVVIPRMELTRDDGVNTSMWFVLDGWNSSGRRLERVTIGSKELDAMNWVTGKWGFSASLAPGTATKDKVAWAIKKVGQLTAKRVTEYNHTGWRKIDGKWCFLYHGGAVGMEGVTVDMGDALKTYRLDGSGAPGFDKISYQEAAERSMMLQSVMKEEIGVALLGVSYLAPLREFMNQMDIVPAFALFLYGESGTHKTTAAALAMSHFGNFHAKNPPASFNDTGNQIRKKAFLVKDMPLLVDDYHPVSSLQEKRQMAATAQVLSRAFGDGVDRGRLNADSTIKASTPPRSVAIITGEDLPAIGASGLARYFILDIDKGDIPVGKELTDMQEAARQGYMQKAMRGYIRWLEGQTDQLPQRLHDMFLHFREMNRTMGGDQHGRAPEAVACILIGYAMMLDYFRNLGLFDVETAKTMLQDAHRALMNASKAQSADMENEKPTRIFLDSMGELLASRSVVLKDLTPGSEGHGNKKPGEDMAGYFDNDYYYLLPQVAFGCVSRLCREQGIEFPVSLKALYKHLRTDGVLKGFMDGGDTPTRNKWIDGRSVRLLWIPRSAMDGPKPEVKQQQMDFTQVDDADLPEEWKQ